VYIQANTATTNAATADQKAVSSGVYANAAYTQTNTATTNAATADQKAVTSGSYANSAYGQANTATTNAGSASSYANSAYGAANTSTTNAATADQRAVTSGSYANAAFGAANTADQRAVTSGSYANSAFGTANTSSTNVTAASSYANGAFASANTRLATSGGTISGDLSVTGVTTLAETTEVLSTLTGATGTVTHNLQNGTTFYHTSPSANWTANFTNVPTTADRTIVVSIIVIQGGTAYYPSAVQIDGAAQTINWFNNTVPTASASKKEIYSFTLIRTSGAWTVFGSEATFG